MSITVVNTSAALVAALKIAQAGDTIQLASGVYSAVSLTGLHFASAVTITSQGGAGATRAIIDGLSVRASDGLTFTDLELRVGGTQAYAATITQTDRISFDRVYVHGSLNNDPSDDAGGLMLRDSTHLSVTNSTFEQLYWGIAHLNDTGLQLSGNTFRNLRMDGIRGGGSSDVVITGNRFSDFHPTAADHADAIQFWTSNTTTSAHNIRIEDNVFVRSGGDVAQGVFLRDEIGGLPFRNVVIRGNLILGGMYNGIAVNGAQGLIIEDNIVQGFLDMKSWVRVDNADNVVLDGNMANIYLLTAVTHLTNIDSQVVPQTADQGAALQAIWDFRHRPIGLSLAGTAGDDTLTGGDLADTLSGGSGNDLLTGGAGNDLYIADKPRIVEDPGGGVDTVRTTVSYTLPPNVENLELAGTKATTGQGNTLDNVITGNDAANRLLGRGGADTLSGGAGNDTLNGGTGADDLTGGPGADVFVFVVGDGKDVIHDFGAGGEADVLDVSAWMAAGKPLLAETTAGVTVSLGADSVLLEGVKLAHLQATAVGWVFV